MAEENGAVRPEFLSFRRALALGYDLDYRARSSLSSPSGVGFAAAFFNPFTCSAWHRGSRASSLSLVLFSASACGSSPARRSPSRS